MNHLTEYQSPSHLDPFIQTEKHLLQNDDFDNILFFEFRRPQCTSPDLEKIFNQGIDSQLELEQQQKEDAKKEVNYEDEIAFEFDFQYFEQDATENEEPQQRQCQKQSEDKQIEPIFKLSYILTKKISKRNKVQENQRKQRVDALKRYRQKKEKRKYSQLTEDTHQTSTIDFSVLHNF